MLLLYIRQQYLKRRKFKKKKTEIDRNSFDMYSKTIFQSVEIITYTVFMWAGFFPPVNSFYYFT